MKVCRVILLCAFFYLLGARLSVTDSWIDWALTMLVVASCALWGVWLAEDLRRLRHQKREADADIDWQKKGGYPRL